MIGILKNPSTKRAELSASKASELNDISKITSEIISGYYINDKEVETNIEYSFYINRKILKKLYQNNRLCMITILKIKNTQKSLNDN